MEGAMQEATLRLRIKRRNSLVYRAAKEGRAAFAIEPGCEVAAACTCFACAPPFAKGAGDAPV